MLLTITQGIAYFLAGSFLISNYLLKQPTGNAMQTLDWFSIGVGALLILAGFITVLSMGFSHGGDFQYSHY